MTRQSRLLLDRLTELSREQGWSVQRHKSMVGIFKGLPLGEQVSMVRKLEAKGEASGRYNEAVRL